MDNVSHAPAFFGIWRTDTAAFHFRADGTFETLHVPSTGTFEVMRDAEWTRRPVTSKTGYLLLILTDVPAGCIGGGALYAIDHYSPSEATLRELRRDGGKTITIRRDASEEVQRD